MQKLTYVLFEKNRRKGTLIKSNNSKDNLLKIFAWEEVCE